MTTEETNPFASPTSDITQAGKPSPDHVYPMTPTATASWEEVPEPHGSTVRTFGMRFLVGLASILLRILVVVPFYILIAYGPTWLNLGGNLSVLFLVSAMAIFIVLIYAMNAFGDDHWWEVLMRRQLRIRKDPWITPEHGHSEFVTLTATEPLPMASFQLGSSETEILDIAMLAFDKSKGELIVEGDKRHYRIPRGALLDCDVRQIKLQSPWTPVVRVAFQTSEGPYEFCILPRDTNPWQFFTTRQRRKRAELLASEIYGLPNLSAPD